MVVLPSLLSRGTVSSHLLYYSHKHKRTHTDMQLYRSCKVITRPLVFYILLHSQRHIPHTFPSASLSQSANACTQAKHSAPPLVQRRPGDLGWVLPVAAAEISAQGVGGRMERALARDHTTFLPIYPFVRLMNERKVFCPVCWQMAVEFSKFIYNEAPLGLQLHQRHLFSNCV